MDTAATHHTLFDLDRELDSLLDEILEKAEENGEENIPPVLITQFQHFCDAFNQKVDRIGQFLITLDARASHCRSQASRLTDRARVAENKAARTKKMVLYYLQSRGLKKIEGLETALRLQKNSQDSVVITNDELIPLTLREIEAKFPGAFWQRLLACVTEDNRREMNACIRESHPCAASIKAAKMMNEEIPGAEVKRGVHLRIE